MTMGLEKILNTKDSNPLDNPDVFRQIVKASNQPLSETLKYIGKKTKLPKVTDEDKSKARLEKLESKSEEKS